MKEGIEIWNLERYIFFLQECRFSKKGRILREKHERPMVIDIVDQHPVFKKQWTKRKTFYKKSKYNINEESNTDVTESVVEETVEEPRNKCKGVCLLNIDSI